MSSSKIGANSMVGAIMNLNLPPTALLVLVLLVSTARTAEYQTVSDDADAECELSITELTVSKVTPATDTLWDIDDPQTDEDWQVFIDAADITIAAFEQAKVGGSGPNDDTWTADDRWKVYADEVIAAANSTKIAIEARDMDAIWEAGSALYTPCQTCQIDSNPAVIESN
jgi:hypothetical protein